MTVTKNVTVTLLWKLDNLMRNINYFKGKRVTIVGLARSGLACANLLDDIGARVSVTDINVNAATKLNAQQLNSKNIKSELGKHTKCFIKGSDFVVVSPGVDEASQAVIWARQFKIPVISEIEVAAILCPGTIIAITGSNGKTTVTTLIARVIEKKGSRVFTLGNIGNPFSGEVSKIKTDDFVSLEVSSFQLENIKSFKPKISVILNFSPNHLDRYQNLQEYLQAKKRIFMNQDASDYLVLNSDCPHSRPFVNEAKAKAIFFKQKDGLNANQAAVLAVGAILGIEEDLCKEVFREFKGIEHRLEEVAELKHVKFINDSKATTPESCIWALNNLPGRIILIAGGKHKGVDYRVILDGARKKVKEAVLIGQAKEKIAEAFKGIINYKLASTMEEAVSLAYNNASAGDYILLSPMCSSFDMFTSFEDRGRVFKKAVSELVRGVQ